SKSRVLPLDDPASRFQRDCFHTPDAQYRRIVDVMAKSPAICTRAICQFAVISAAIAVELRCKLDLKTFEFNRSCTHNLVAARRIELEALARRLSRAPKSRAKPRDLPQFTLKTKSPRFVSEAQKDYALLMCPRYMNVPSPAPCHVNVAGVGKQSVWGLRIIARTQLSLCHDSTDSSIARNGVCPAMVVHENFSTTPLRVWQSWPVGRESVEIRWSPLTHGVENLRRQRQNQLVQNPRLNIP